ncbi:MAG: hypothetical protein JSU80_01870 [Deltaproteobacteria bacterium]|nr:MAG: hypothetical protein JSU80_01870 [Deltaproteobacteria bacterium]
MNPVMTFCPRIRGGKNFLLRLALLGLIFLLSSPSCSKEDEAEKIRSLIKEGAELAEKHDISGLIKFTTEDFSAQPGNQGSREVRRILWFAFNYYGNFRIMYPEPSVDLGPEGRDGSARVYFLIVKKEQSAPKVKDLYKDPKGWIQEVGESADLYRLSLELLKENGDWLVKRALLEPFRGTGFSG